jgi:Negative regulator of sigma F
VRKTHEADGLGALGALDAPAPPASASLLGAVGAMKPARTRTRFGAFAVVCLVGLGWPAFTLAQAPFRRDLAALPAVWIALGAALWAAAFALSLSAALVPRRGDVMPSAGIAARLALGAMATLLVFVALWIPSVPGVSLHPADLGVSTLQSTWGCAKVVLETAIPVVLLGFVVLRRVLPVGGRAAGVALGAAGGALGGLTLHFVCPMATTSHVLIGHVGAMIVASVVGALLLGFLIDRT